MYSGEYMFRQEYGSNSLKYPCVDPIGNPSPEVTSNLWIGVVLLIAGIIVLLMSKSKKKEGTYDMEEENIMVEEENIMVEEENIMVEKENNNDTKKSKTNKLLKYLGILLIVAGIGLIIFYFYKYVSCYWPQYDQWYLGLDRIGRLQFNNIKLTKMMKNDNRFNQSNSTFAFNF